MKIIFFIGLVLFLLIPQIAYGSEITAEPEKILFNPNEWIRILIDIDGYSGGDVIWSATLPDGTTTNGVLSDIKASKTTHTIIRNAFDGQFGTWIISYEYGDTVKVINVNVDPLIVSVTTDQSSYFPWDTAIVKISTNYYDPSAAKAETLTIDILDNDDVPANFFDDVKIKMYQPVIIQHFSIDEFLSQNPFGVYHAIVTYYDVTVDIPFELTNPDTNTSVFLSSNKKAYSPHDIVELNIITSKIISNTGTLSIVLPSDQLITKTIPISNSLTRVILDDIDTSKIGLYSLEFEYGASHTVGSFDVYDESLESSDGSSLELNVILKKSQYHPGETIHATISTSDLIDNPITYWFEDSSANRGQQFSFVNPTSGTFNLSHTIPVDFLQGPSKLYVKYGTTETFAIFFVFGESVTPENSEIHFYDGPEVLLTIDNSLINLGNISDISISPNSELFVVDSDTSKINIFDINGNFINSWDASDITGNLINPTSILAEKSIVHVVDMGNSRIVTFDNDGNFIREWGNSGIDYQSVQNPTDIAVDDLGIYYVSDGNQNKILKYDSDGIYVDEINSILTASAKFVSIESITISGDDVFLLSTTNNRILHFHSNGGFLKSFGTAGQSDKQIQNPTSLEFDNNDNLYVADSGNSRVLVLNTSGEYVTKWGTFGTGLGQFNKIAGIDVDLNGDVWVADSGNRIQKFVSISNVDKPNIPEWVKNNSIWWAEDQMDDTTFVESIRYLINAEIICARNSS